MASTTAEEATDTDAQRQVSFHDFYNAITCNRCGQCCEAFSLPPVETLTRYLPWALVPDHVIERRAWPQNGLHDAVHATIEDAKGYKRLAMWLMALEPNDEPMLVPRHRGDPYPVATYRCPRFYREPDGMGVCGLGDDRPPICKAYPLFQATATNVHEGSRTPIDVVQHSLAVSGFDQCAWNVDVEPDPRSEQRRQEAADYVEKVEAA